MIYNLKTSAVLPLNGSFDLTVNRSSATANSTVEENLKTLNTGGILTGDLTIFLYVDGDVNPTEGTEHSILLNLEHGFGGNRLYFSIDGDVYLVSADVEGKIVEVKFVYINGAFVPVNGVCESIGTITVA
jgi:hypothetical protein